MKELIVLVSMEHFFQFIGEGRDIIFNLPLTTTRSRNRIEYDKKPLSEFLIPLLITLC